MVSPEIPLAQFGGINTGRYRAGAVPESNHVYAWPMNNYWTTNFNADQRGGHAWTYYLTSSADATDAFQGEFSAAYTFEPARLGLKAGDQRFRVQLTTDEIRTPITKEESTRVYADE